MMTNKEVARILKDTSALIDLTGGNAFRARAMSNAARNIERLDESVSTLAADGSLQELRGIGGGLAAQIQGILEQGTFDVYEDLLGAIPPGLTEILRVKGLGAKKVRKIWQTLGITTLEELEEAATIGQLADLDGFGKKTQENVLKHIHLLKQYGERRRYDQASMEAARMLEKILAVDSIDRAELAGALRRNLEVVDAVVIVAAASVINAACNELIDFWETSEERSDGCRTLGGKLPDGMPLEIHVVLPGRFGMELWRQTGSAAHVAAMEADFELPSTADVEAEIYETAGLPYIEAELREMNGEIDAAAGNRLPRLLALEDLHGSLHNHSTYSDGAHSLRQMTEAARGMGFSYYGACDHSRSLSVAGGLSIERVREQQEEIRRLNAEFGTDLHVFSGTESDILGDGSLDYPDEVLASFDLVVASIHTRFSMSVEEATTRLIRAVENPFTTILGHPTGRLLLRREGYPVDHEKVIDACAANGVAIEVNANPRRLDIDWRWIRHATARGVLVAINPDAHSVDELYYMRWGVAAARKGWLTPGQCLNAMPLEAFAAWLDAKHSQQGITQV
jgi:DNA polymerase (family 10)